MRAIRVHAYGQPLRIDDISPPGPPDAGQLGGAITAVGVGSWDVGVAHGRGSPLGGSGLVTVHA